MTLVLLNRKHVAQLLSCSVGTVDNLVKRGELGYTRRWAGGPKCFTWTHINEYERRLNERTKFERSGRKKAA